MKNWIWCLLTIPALLCTGLSQAQEAGSDNEKAVVALEYVWLKADQTNNVDLAAPYFADKYVATGIDGKQSNKADTIADGRVRKYSSAGYEDVKAIGYGDSVVIVTGGYTGKGTDSGKPFSEHWRWTDTWVKMPGGKWQCVATHYSEIK
jgi:hypothetical protein